MRVKYSYVHPQVMMTQHSWWEPESVTDPDFGATEFNANMLMPLGIHSSTGFGGNQTKSMLCRLRKVDTADLPASRGT